MSHTITAMFDQQSEARAAEADLISAGVPRDAIRVLPGAEAGRQNAGGYDHRGDEGGFWASLKDVFMPDEDRYAYSEGLSRGATMVTVKGEDRDRERTFDILERRGAVDLDQREADWRRDGWQGYRADAAPAAARRDEPAAAARGAADETSIPLVEERLKVGKRTVEHGRVRLRSYVVETPVKEQIALHDELVRVERRAVDRAATPADEALFAERTIEADERVEEAVVSKEARVVGEVGLRREGVDHTETVEDKLRKTEVEVEDGRTGAARDGAARPPARRG